MMRNMRELFLYIAVSGFSFGLSAQQTSWKFDFGSGKTMKGYIAVTTSTMYNDATGYGFDKYSTDLQAADGKTKHALLTDYISSPKP